jgi:hypothetical protein
MLTGFQEVVPDYQRNPGEAGIGKLATGNTGLLDMDPVMGYNI